MESIFPNEVLTPKTQPLVDRGRYLVNELTAGFDYLLDDGVDEPADAALATAKRRLAEDDNRATLIQALVALSGIAADVRQRLATEISFDVALIDESAALANTLSEAGVPNTGFVASELVDLRKRLMTLTDNRVREIRKAARFVFRNHPDIVQKAASAHRRRRWIAKRQRNTTTTTTTGDATN
jgi:hypothetical protein